MNGKTITLIFIALTGVGALGLGFYFIYSMIQSNNEQNQEALQVELNNENGGGGLGGIIGGLTSLFA
jgi:hypothetical protein